MQTVKYDVGKLIEAAFAEQDAGLPSIHTQALLVVALLLYDRMQDGNAPSIDLQLDMAELVDASGCLLSIGTDTEKAITYLSLHPHRGSLSFDGMIEIKGH